MRGRVNEMVGMIISDIHFGAVDTQRLYDELEEFVLKVIDRLDRLDFIIITGDTTDYKSYVNSPTITQLIVFLKQLIKRTERLDTTIDIIEGTAYHDNKQVKILLDLLEHPRIRTFTEVTQTTIKDKLNVLYIPEEYVVDQEEYYKDYLSEGNFYDIIAGHGMVDKVWFSTKAKNKDKVTRVPVFKVDELLTRCKRCYFGHIHTGRAYGHEGRFKYVGNFTRDKFGEEEPKGYYLVAIDEVSGVIDDEFIINTMAPPMKTLMIDIREDLPLGDLKALIDDTLQDQRDTLTRLLINIDNVDTAELMYDSITQLYGKNPYIKLVVSRNVPKEIMESMQEVMVKDTATIELDCPIEDQISEFIRSKTGKNISPETVLSCITDIL